MLQELDTKQTYDQLREQSAHGPVFVLKHSLVCSISGYALGQFERFLEENDTVPGFLLKIQENRELSNFIAEDTGVVHQSPQVLLFREGKVAWNESHHAITAENLAQNLE